MFRLFNCHLKLCCLVWLSGFSGVLLAQALPTACQEPSQCTIDVLVAYTESAAAWSGEGDGVSCKTLLDTGADAIFDKFKLRMSKSEAFQAIEHPCRSQANFATSQDTMDNLIAIGMAELNAIYRNSGLPIRFRLVGKHRLSNADGTPYTEGSWKENGPDYLREIRHEDDIARFLSDNVSILGELIKARNTEETPEAFRALAEAKANSGADLVIVIVGENYGGPTVKGIASATGVMDPQNAVTVLQVQGALAPVFALSHEVSHLMGAGHYEFKSAINLGAVKFLALDAVNSYGYRHARAAMTPDNRYATIMGGADKYSGYKILPFLSNNTVEVVMEGNEDNVLMLGELDDNNEPVRDNAHAVMQTVALIEQFNGQGAKTYPQKTNRIAIDFGYETLNGHPYQSLTTGDSRYGYWNNLVNHRRDASLGGEDNPILTQSGQATPIKLRVSSSFSGKNTPSWIVRAFSDYGFDSVPPMAISDGFYALSNWNSGELIVENLDVNNFYTFEFYGSGPGMDETRKTRYSINGRNGFGEPKTYSAVLTTEPNILRAAKISGVRPNADGSLTIRVSGETNWVWHTANLNALRFWPAY